MSVESIGEGMRLEARLKADFRASRADSIARAPLGKGHLKIDPLRPLKIGWIPSRSKSVHNLSKSRIVTMTYQPFILCSATTEQYQRLILNCG
jgi:hypothetical protein